VETTRWLSTEEQRAWRSYIRATILLQARLGRELQRAHGLTIADYEILVRLSESPGRRARMSELAELTQSSRSRLSHQITRMERAGLVSRQAYTEDRRGALAVMTDEGWQRLVDAAPTHVEGVRRHLVDQMSPEAFTEVGKAFSGVTEHLVADADYDVPSCPTGEATA
jgi:DNA-binding MarR family transcriptional regulator